MSGPVWSRRNLLLALGAMGSWSALTTAIHAQPVQPPIQINNQFKIKAKLLYFLPDFMAWPADKQKGDIQIGVIHHGNSQKDFDNEIANLKTTASGRKVRWEQFRTADDLIKAPASSSKNWHLIFVMRDDKNENATLETLEKLDVSFGKEKSGIVLVTEENTRFRKLAAINFYEDVAANRIRIQLRKTYLEEKVGVTPKPEMLKIEGILVY